MNEKYIAYTKAHRKAFIRLEKELLGYNTFAGYTHDLDKIILYHFLPKAKVSKLHRKYSRHHDRAKTYFDYVQMVIDWECARETKPDKPLDARETLEIFYPELKPYILPILEEFDL